MVFVPLGYTVPNGLQFGLDEVQVHGPLQASCALRLDTPKKFQCCSNAVLMPTAVAEFVTEYTLQSMTRSTPSLTGVYLRCRVAPRGAPAPLPGRLARASQARLVS